MFGIFPLKIITHEKREAQYHLGEAAPANHHKYVQTSAGLLHLYMAVVKLVFNSNLMAGNSARWSLDRWINLLGRDGDKLRSTLAKDHSSCVDFLETVLDGCLLAIICNRLFPNCQSADVFAQNINTKSTDEITETLCSLQSGLSKFETVSNMRLADTADRNLDLENMLLFVQQALIVRIFGQAMRQGDSGRVINCISFFTVWFQDSGCFNYASGTLRLLVCLRRLWSEDLRRYWMETCLITTSGKENSFVALDEFNEYIVREVKEMIANNVTPATDSHLRNTLSLLITLMWDARRKIADEMDANIFDFHSSKVDSWRDIKLIADNILQSGILSGITQDTMEEETQSPAPDLLMNGMAKLATIEPLDKLKDSWYDEEDDADEGIELGSEGMDREIYDPEEWGDAIDSED